MERYIDILLTNRRNRVKRKVQFPDKKMQYSVRHSRYVASDSLQIRRNLRRQSYAYLKKYCPKYFFEDNAFRLEFVLNSF